MAGEIVGKVPPFSTQHPHESLAELTDIGNPSSGDTEAGGSLDGWPARGGREKPRPEKTQWGKLRTTPEIDHCFCISARSPLCMALTTRLHARVLEGDREGAWEHGSGQSACLGLNAGMLTWHAPSAGFHLQHYECPVHVWAELRFPTFLRLRPSKAGPHQKVMNRYANICVSRWS